MRNPLYNDDFEHYLQKQVGQHRMYPSDHIWRNIQQEVHGNRRWPALTFISITVISLLVAGTLLIKPETKLKTIEAYSLAKAQPVSEAASTQAEPVYESIEERISPNKLTEKTIAAVKTKLNTANTYTLPQNPVADNRVSVDDENLHAVASQNNNKAADAKDKILNISNFNASSLKTIEPENAKPLAYSADLLNSYIIKEDSKQPEIQLNLPAGRSLLKGEFNKPGAIKFNKQKNKSDRLSFLFYITPSSSYRKLVDDKQARINSSYIPANSTVNFADANQVVRHRPAMGVELGFGIGYSLNKRFTLKTGLQFNIRQYNIEAYNSNYEQATIGAGTDTYSAVSAYRNFGGNSPVTLRNKNYEISVPLGIDYKIVDAGRISWNIAAALQPTYIFDKEPFLLSSDLKSYADGSSIMRKWNINTSLETYLSIQAGEYRWQIGPQFRYQNLPTYNSKYPIKEHLLDYGIKIGFSRRIN